MLKFFFIIQIGTLFLYSIPSIHAGTLFASRGLDPSFCQIKSVRETVIYIDDMIMIEGKKDWAIKLHVKLKASLSPGERTTVVRLSPKDGHSTDIWSGCWPDFSAEQRAEIAKNTYLRFYVIYSG